MSMNFSVYVGPYIKVTHAQSVTMDELTYGFEHLVQDGRYEAADLKERKSGVMYFIPNADVPGIERQTTFSEQHDDDVVNIFPTEGYESVGEEIVAFSRFVMPFWTSLQRTDGISVSTCWGVVPCWR